MSAILVHGGAGPHGDGRREAKIGGVRRAAEIGWSVLESGGSALDAVEAAVREMESNPLFDAGYGSYLNLDGVVEVDAILMDGASLEIGAVASVEHVAHPVTLARVVLTDTPHAMLVGHGAERLARERGLAVPAPDLVAPSALERWRRERAGVAAPTPDLGDTVGAVGVDRTGHVAAATSTGGTSSKRPGRVGDSPLVGCGAYADDRCGAVSCTGEGEAIMRICLAHAASARLADGSTAQTVAEWAVRLLGQRVGGQGGTIVVDRAGGLGWSWNTAAMPYAWHDDDGAGAGM